MPRVLVLAGYGACMWYRGGGAGGVFGWWYRYMVGYGVVVPGSGTGEGAGISLRVPSTRTLPWTQAKAALFTFSPLHPPQPPVAALEGVVTPKNW